MLRPKASKMRQFSHLPISHRTSCSASSISSFIFKVFNPTARLRARPSAIYKALNSLPSSPLRFRRPFALPSPFTPSIVQSFTPLLPDAQWLIPPPGSAQSFTDLGSDLDSISAVLRRIDSKPLAPDLEADYEPLHQQPSTTTAGDRGDEGDRAGNLAVPPPPADQTREDAYVFDLSGSEGGATGSRYRGLTLDSNLPEPSGVGVSGRRRVETLLSYGYGGDGESVLSLQGSDPLAVPDPLSVYRGRSASAGPGGGRTGNHHVLEGLRALQVKVREMEAARRASLDRIEDAERRGRNLRSTGEAEREAAARVGADAWAGVVRERERIRAEAKDVEVDVVRSGERLARAKGDVERVRKSVEESRSELRGVEEGVEREEITARGLLERMEAVRREEGRAAEDLKEGRRREAGAAKDLEGRVADAKLVLEGKTMARSDAEERQRHVTRVLDVVLGLNKALVGEGSGDRSNEDEGAGREARDLLDEGGRKAGRPLKDVMRGAYDRMLEGRPEPKARATATAMVVTGVPRGGGGSFDLKPASAKRVETDVALLGLESVRKGEVRGPGRWSTEVDRLRNLCLKCYARQQGRGRYRIIIRSFLTSANTTISILPLTSLAAGRWLR